LEKIERSQIRGYPIYLNRKWIKTKLGRSLNDYLGKEFKFFKKNHKTAMIFATVFKYYFAKLQYLDGDSF